MENLIGRKYSKLTVIEFAFRRGRRYYWKCLCECGNCSNVDPYRLANGRIKSCGCLNASKNRTTNLAFKSWRSMIDRCTNKNHVGYADYGGRNIFVCDRWLNSFENFLEDMGDRPSKKHSIERNDTNDGYYKENCKWATTKEQTRNKRNNVWLEYNGERMILADWASKLKVNPVSIKTQLRKGKSFAYLVESYLLKQALNSNKRVSSKTLLDTNTGIFYDSIVDAAKAKCISYAFLNRRIRGVLPNSTGIVLI